MVEQLTLTVEAPVADAPSGGQHRLILAALLTERDRGLSGEEAAQRCGIRLASSATTRMEEMSKDTKVPDRFPVPLVFHSAKKERPTASGRLSYVWFLSDVGKRVAAEMRES
jgi:hypothetical protein